MKEFIEKSINVLEYLKNTKFEFYNFVNEKDKDRIEKIFREDVNIFYAYSLIYNIFILTSNITTSEFINNCLIILNNFEYESDNVYTKSIIFIYQLLINYNKKQA